MNKTDIIKDFNLHETVAEVLIERGYDEYWKLNRFINPKLAELNEPSFILNIDKVKNKILQHIDFGSKIYVFGDYDVDGVTSAAILYKTLKRMNANVEGKISSRFKGGYSFSKQEIDEMGDSDLIISLDCGISSYENIQYAKNKGIDFIVIDHHEQDNPPDITWVDLKVDGGAYPFNKLSGAGITWKVCQHLVNDRLNNMLDLVALSTIADMVPLYGENRIIAKYGLNKMENTTNIGLKELFKVNDVSDVSVGNIAYKVAPCINAQGRLDNNQISFELLTTNDNNKAKENAKQLYDINEVRKEETKKGLELAEKQVNQGDNFIIVQGDFPPGIVGLIASDIKEKFNKPTLVFSKGNKIVKGSGRSVSPLHLFNTFNKFKYLFESGGGHEKAIGCSIKKNNLSKLKNKLNEYTRDIKYKKHWYDVELNINKVSKKLIDDLEIFQPCGIGNPNPRFFIKKRPTNINKSKDGKHLFFNLGQYRCVAFNKGEESLSNCFVGSLEYNDFRGKRSIQVNIKNILREGE